MKKKLLFKKVTALLCAVVMLVTTFVPTVYAAPGEPEKVSVNLTVSEDVVLYNCLGGQQLSGTFEGFGGVDFYWEVKNDVITCIGWNTATWEQVTLNGKTIQFYAKEVTPSDTDKKVPSLYVGSASATLKYEEGPYELDNGDTAQWKISLTITHPNGAANLGLKLVDAPKPPVTVTFPTESSYSIKVIEGTTETEVSGTYSVAQGSDVVFKVVEEVPNPSTQHAVYVGGEKLIAKDGVYKIENVQSATKVNVVSETKTFTVTGLGDKGIYRVSGAQTVKYGADYSFNVIPKEGYGAPTSVTVADSNGNDVEYEYISGTLYTIYGVTDSITITVVPGDRNSFTVTGPATNNGFHYIPATDDTTVKINGSFTFTVIPADGYDKPTVIYTQGNDLTELTPASLPNNQYRISGIQNDITIIVKAGTRKTYVVHAPETSDGYTFNLTGGSENKTEFYYGEDVNFIVTAKDGYEVTAVRVNGTKVTAKDGVYTTTVNDSNIDIIVDVKTKNFSVTYKYNSTDAGFTVVEADASAAYGSRYTFNVEPKTGYGAPTVEYTVGDSTVKTPVSGVNGQYTIPQIKGATTIYITASEKNKYDVTLNPAAGVEYTPKEVGPVKHGESLVFSFKLDTAYDQSTPVVSVNNKVVAATKNEDGSYTCTVASVTENQVVTVSDVQKNTYKVSFVNDDGYTLNTTESTNVTAGDEFRFTLTVAAGYTNTPVVKAGGNVVGLVNGYYTIKVEKNTTITVEGVNPITYKVTSLTAPNATVKRDGSDETISYNGDYIFTVKADDGYRVTSVVVNKRPVNPTNGNYYVNEIKSDLTIVVTTVENELTINYECNADNHQLTDLTTSTLKYNEIGANAIAAHVSTCLIHEFDGWYNGETPATVDYLQSLINTENATVTLIAKFNERSEEDIANALVDLAQTQRVFDAAAVNNTSSVRVTFRTRADAKWDACVSDYVKVTAHGTLLLNTLVNFNTPDVVAALEGATETPNGLQQLGEKIEGKNVYYCRTNCNMNLEDVNGQEIILRASAKNPATYFAAGWLELTVGENVKVIIVSATNDAPAANAD